ncbi:MAG: amino acid adenylation domain-containing protein [Pseudomonadota bacterium]
MRFREDGPRVARNADIVRVISARADSIAGRFECQVLATPEAIAIRHHPEQYTYIQLDRAANQVANSILSRRGSDEEPVALLAEPGASAIVLLLGALKAGKFYVPLDPAHPRQRLTSIVEDVRPTVFLTTARHRDLVRTIAPSGCEVIGIDELQNPSSDQPDCGIPEDRLGYVFYTSGSTGRAKGVMQTQRNILRQIDDYASGLGVTSADHLTVFHSHAFSASRLDIFTGLLHGATIHPFSVNDEGLENMAAWLEKDGITIAHSVPTLFRHFVASLEAARTFPALRAVVLGSEPVLPSDVSLFKMRHFPDRCVLVNRFGSTETGNICWSFVDKNQQISADVVPVGFAVSGVEVVIAGDDGLPVAPGEVGQVCVRSRFLSPGYWNNPELTRTAFVAGRGPGDAQMYLTGDLGRLRPDGALEHLGRKDSQVKIRGFRIELQEIESVLSTHSDVQEVVVVALPRTADEPDLVAFVVPAPGTTTSPESLIRWLSEQLPHYMVPSSVIVVDKLPETATGKIDRRALAQFRDQHRVSTSDASLPSDYIEIALVRMWTQVLGVAAVSVNDNFFALGGDSLLAAGMALRIQRAFGHKVSSASVLQAPTIRQLADLLRGGHIEPIASASLLTIQPLGTRTPFFWIHGDHSNAYLADYLGSDQPIYGVEHQMLDGRPAVYTDVVGMARHYLRQVRVIQAEGPYLIGGYSFGGTVAFEMARQLTAEGQSVALLAMLDSLFPTVSEAWREPENLETTQTLSLSQTALSHFANLARLPLRERFEYVKKRVSSRIAESDAFNYFPRVVFPNAVRNLVCETCLALGLRLPMFVRTFYLLSVYRKALNEYQLVPWAGRGLYFKSTHRDGVHLRQWRRLVEHGLESHEVPGDHGSVINRENSAAWAVPLKIALEKAQRSLAQQKAEMQAP